MKINLPCTRNNRVQGRFLYIRPKRKPPCPGRLINRWASFFREACRIPDTPAVIYDVMFKCLESALGEWPSAYFLKAPKTARGHAQSIPAAWGRKRRIPRGESCRTLRRAQSLFVNTVGGERVVSVRDAYGLRADGNTVALQAVGVAAAVPALMVVAANQNAYRRYSLSSMRSRPDKISQPCSVCVFIRSNSSFVSRPGLLRIASGIDISQYRAARRRSR